MTRLFSTNTPGTGRRLRPRELRGRGRVYGFSDACTRVGEIHCL